MINQQKFCESYIYSHIYTAEFRNSKNAHSIYVERNNIYYILSY